MYTSKLTILAVTLLAALVLLLNLASPPLAAAQAPLGFTDTPTPTPTATLFPTWTPTPVPGGEAPPVVPEASTLILLGSAALGLSGYVGLQIRLRRGS